MITLGRAAFQTILRTNEYYGLSTGPKPTAAIGTFDIPNGNYITLTNNHPTNAMFIHYGCRDLR